MTSRNPVLLIGLDAFDPALARRWAASGELPALARLFEGSARSPVLNPVGTYVGALWANFATGLSADGHGFHCWDEIEIASYRHRLVTPKLTGIPKFWDRIEESGARVAAIDVPHMRIEGEPTGVRIFEWGCHDRHFGLQCWPPGLAEGLTPHPVLGVDPHAVRDFAADDIVHRAGEHRTAEETRPLVDGLVEGAAMKSRLLTELYADGGWDLFLAVYGESHAAGHQLWHLHDETHPGFDRALRDAAGGDPLLRIYREIDGGIGRLLDLAPAGATVLVLMSHGMGPHHDGAHLLDKVLARLDSHYSSRSPRLGNLLGRATDFGRTAADRLRLPRRLRAPLAALGDCGAAAVGRARRRFFLAPNNFVYGGIRFNLRGREPRGLVEPAEIDGWCDRLEQDLQEIVNEATGRPIIRRLIRADDHHRRTADDTLPDLFIDWERDAPIETVSSPKIGRIHMPYTGWRTGDHRDEGLLLASGPGLDAGEREPVAVEDIGALVAARLGVGCDGSDGRFVPWLAAPELEREPA